MATASEQVFEPGPMDDGQNIAAYTDFPCSVAQERFWLLDRLEPGNPSYNVAVRWRLEGPLAAPLLENAWREILTRHEVLRTQFLEIDGKPVQRVAARVAFKLTEIDLSALAPEARTAEGDRIGLIEARAPFDLGTGPLVRVVLLRFSPTSAIVLVTTHQIVSDGWSIGVMAREMGAIYEALSTGAPLPLDPIPIQYGDYALWQLEWLRQRGNAAETAYWSKQLAGVTPFEVLPDRPRPAVPTTNGAIASLVLPRELTNRLQSLTAEHGVTLFSAAVATLCATLWRYTGKAEIVVGTQVSDRDQVELEPMIGQFVNSLILRNDMRGDPRFSELLQRVSSTISAALEHRHIPIERLLGMVKAGRGGSNSPPVSINFIFQRTFIENRQYGALALIDMPSLPAGAIYDLNFFMVERPDGWRFSVQFNTDQFEAQTASRLLRFFQSAMHSAVAAPSRRISELRLAEAAEAQALLTRLNGADVALAGDPTLSTRISAQARTTPGSVALVCGDRKLTYAQLEADSTQFALALKARGIGPGKRVGVCLDRSPELLLAILGTWKAGAAWIALDPRDPAARLQRVLDGAQADIAVAPASLSLKLPSGVITNIAAERPAGGAALPTVPPAAEAAIWFGPNTGSTGIRISHHELRERLERLASRLGLRATDVCLSLGAPVADAVPAELLMPLCIGARIVIPPAGDSQDPVRLQNLLKRSHVTIAQATGAKDWRQLLDCLKGQSILPKLVCRRGVGTDLAERMLQSGCEVWALQGYMETAGSLSARRIEQSHDLRLLGEPFANTRLRVLDANLRIPPVGARGLLYAGGNEAGDQEAANFIVDPSDGSHGERLFRTAEAARMRAEGVVEIIDEDTSPQDVGGYKVATSDIVRALRAESGVHEAAVIATRTHVGEMSFTAFIAWNPGVEPGQAQKELQHRATATWPHALLPATFISRESLPHTTAGDVDLRELRNSQNIEAASVDDQTPVDPQMEQQLSAIWAELLGQAHVDPNANFFELGGHSLLAARMLARVEARFVRRVTLASLFRAPTIRGLARLLHSDAREFDFRQMVKLQSDGSKLPLIAINNTGVYYLLAKRLGADQPVTSLQVFDPSARHESLPDTLEGIAAEYVKLIRRVHPNGPYVLAGWCVAGALAFEIGRQLAAAGHPVEQVFLIDSWVPRYFERLPLLRRLIGNYSMRWQLAWADWRRYTSGEQSFAEFINQRVFVRRLRAMLGGAGSAQAGTPLPAGPEDYDRWLLEYLKETTVRYEPQSYSGRVTLFRSTREPTGLLSDPMAGWRPFCTGGLELALVEGDHFTMFQDPGAAQMAAHMSKLIGRGTTPA